MLLEYRMMNRISYGCEAPCVKKDKTTRESERRSSKEHYRTINMQNGSLNVELTINR